MHSWNRVASLLLVASLGGCTGPGTTDGNVPDAGAAGTPAVQSTRPDADVTAESVDKLPPLCEGRVRDEGAGAWVEASEWRAIGDPIPRELERGPRLTTNGVDVWFIAPPAVGYRIAPGLSGWDRMEGPSTLQAHPRATVATLSDRSVAVGVAADGLLTVEELSNSLTWEPISQISAGRISEVSAVVSGDHVVIGIHIGSAPFNEWPGEQPSRIWALSNDQWMELPPPPLSVASMQLMCHRGELTVVAGPQMGFGVPAPTQEPVQIATFDNDTKLWSTRTFDAFRSDVARAVPVGDHILIAGTAGAAALIDVDAQEVISRIDIPPCNVVSVTSTGTTGFVLSCNALLTTDDAGDSEAVPLPSSLGWNSSNPPAVFSDINASEDGALAIVIDRQVYVIRP